MKKNLPLSLLTSLLLGATALLPVLAQAQQMNYQGRLTDTSGNALLDGQYTLTFNLYTNAAGGTAVWGPFVCDSNAGNGHAAKADLVSGRFNVILGPLDTTGRPLAPAFAGGAARYLGIRVEAGAEIAPRQQILAAPEALHAIEADHAALADNAANATHATTADTAANFTSTVLFTDEANKRVGVGISSPAFTLQVVDPGVQTGRIQVGGRGANSSAKRVSFGDGDLVYIGEEDSDDTMALRAGRFTFKTGAASFQNTVNVTGDVKLGPTAQYQASAAEERLRIVRGAGTANTTVGVVNNPISGFGFTYKKVSQGVVDVTFATPFAGTPTVTANPISAGAIFCGLHGLGGTGNPGSTGFRIVMYDTSANGRDWPFNFIAIGPR